MTPSLKEVFAEMGTVAADPMWADHVELPKASLRRWIKAIRPILADRSIASALLSSQDEVARLREALTKLANEVGGLEIAEDAIRTAIGNTNWTVLQLRLTEARSALTNQDKTDE